jgi:hypothetical protein
MSVDEVDPAILVAVAREYIRSEEDDIAIKAVRATSHRVDLSLSIENQ